MNAGTLALAVVVGALIVVAIVVAVAFGPLLDQLRDALSVEGLVGR